MTNLDSILKSKDTTFLIKVRIVKAMVFPVVIYGCESWTMTKGEGQRIDAFKLWCWRRLLRVPWTARRSNRSILKEINPEYSLEGRMLKLQYVGHLKWRADSLEKDPDAGKYWRQEEGNRGRDGWMASLTQWAWANSWKLDREARCAAVHGVSKSWTWLSNWTNGLQTFFTLHDYLQNSCKLFFFFF